VTPKELELTFIELPVKIKEMNINSLSIYVPVIFLKKNLS
jgi:hypothetical protein